MDDPTRNDSGTLIDLYRRHLSRGRALFGQVSGGLSEVASEGAWVITADGRRLLDCGGYGVFLHGHRHPRVVAAVKDQLDRHPLATRVLLEPVTASAAAALSKVAPGSLPHVHFVNSGAEATETALKLARALGHRIVISTHGGFHGKTLAVPARRSGPRPPGAGRRPAWSSSRSKARPVWSCRRPATWPRSPQPVATTTPC